MENNHKEFLLELSVLLEKYDVNIDVTLVDDMVKFIIKNNKKPPFIGSHGNVIYV